MLQCRIPSVNLHCNKITNENVQKMHAEISLEINMRNKGLLSNILTQAFCTIFQVNEAQLPHIGDQVFFEN